MYFIQKSSILIICILLTINVTYSQSTISLDNVKDAIEEELEDIFDHNEFTKSYKIYSLKVDDVNEEDNLYSSTGSFKFKNKNGDISSSIRFDAQVKSALNELTVPAVMVNFDDVVNSWKEPEISTDAPSLPEKIKEKLIERVLTVDDVASVEHLAITDYIDRTNAHGYIEVKAKVKYKEYDGDIGTKYVSAHIKPVENSCVISYFSW